MFFANTPTVKEYPDGSEMTLGDVGLFVVGSACFCVGLGLAIVEWDHWTQGDPRDGNWTKIRKNIKKRHQK